MGALTLLPSLLAIVVALLTKRVVPSLLGGIVLGELLLHDFSLVASAESLFSRFFALLSEGWVQKTLLFALLVGSVMALLERSGAIGALVEYVTKRKALIASARSAQFFVFFIGVLIFIESSITALIAGSIGKPLFDRFDVSRAKLAYVCDATSAPICSLIAINGWGALILGLIVAAGVDAPNTLFLHALLYNFYAYSALGVLLVSIYFGIDTKAMRNGARGNAHYQYGAKERSMRLLFIPFAVLFFALFTTLYITGEGDILHGSGSSAIFYAVLATVAAMFLLYRDVLSFRERTEATVKGAVSMAPIVTVLLFAFLIGDVTGDLKSGEYLALFLQEGVDAAFIPAFIFLLAALTAFATGTSWGTFSIMIPVAVPLSAALGADTALAVGAAISGGVFGDHCSPISDTTIISSLASGCDHIEHVKTQLPYALVGGVIALMLFVYFGWSG